MSINYNPKIVTDGLVLCLDAANLKSFDATENLFTYSETFTSPSLWSLLDCAASKNAVDPNGINNSATTITRNSTAYGGLYVYQPSNGFAVTSGVAYTFSIFLKAGTASSITVSLENSGTGGAVFSYSGITVNLTNGTITSGSGGSIVAYPNGWYRVSITETATATGTAEPGIYSSGTTNFPLNGTMFIWGAQFERASSASRYYATTGTAKNRGTSLTDISGNGNNATLVNGPTYNSSNNGKLVFDGVDDYSRPNISHSYLSSSALEIWFNSASHGSGFKTLFGYAHPNGYSRPVAGEMYLTGNTLAASVITSTQTYREVTFPTSISTNTFYYAVLNKDTVNGTLQLFVNGVAGSTQTFDVATYAQWPSAGVYQGTNVLDIAKSANVQVGQGWENAYFNGSIFRLGVYNRILTLTEIQQNFNALRGRFGV